MDSSASDTKRGIVIFLVLAFGLSSIFYLLIIHKPGQQLVNTLMWCPATAAFLTCALLKRNFGDLGLNWPNPRYLAIAYFTPLAVLLVIYVVIWVTGLSGFPNPAVVEGIAQTFGFENAPVWLTLALYTLVNATSGFVTGAALALGEEIGWRGFLAPQLNKLTTFTKAALVSGVIWAVWHYAIVPTAYAGVPTPLWYQLLFFTIGSAAFSVALLWIRLKSGSVWPCVFMHASYNLFAQSIFNALSTDTSVAPHIVGDLGVAVATFGIVMALIFWRRRAEVEAQPAETSPSVTDTSVQPAR